MANKYDSRKRKTDNRDDLRFVVNGLYFIGSQYLKLLLKENLPPSLPPWNWKCKWNRKCSQQYIFLTNKLAT